MAQVQPNEMKIFHALTNIPAPDDDATSIGGAIGVPEISNSQGDILDDITVDKVTAKDRYTKVFIKNDGSVTATDVSIYLSSTEPAAHAWRLGEEFSGGDSTTQGTAPTSVSFVDQDGTIAGRVTVGDLTAGSSVGIWLHLNLGTTATTQNLIDWDFKLEWV